MGRKECEAMRMEKYQVAENMIFRTDLLFDEAVFTKQLEKVPNFY